MLKDSLENFSWACGRVRDACDRFFVNPIGWRFVRIIYEGDINMKRKKIENRKERRKGMLEMRRIRTYGLGLATAAIGGLASNSTWAQNPDLSQFSNRETLTENVAPNDSVDTFTFVDYSDLSNVDGKVKASDYPVYLKKAKTGDTEAMRLVAICHLTGTGVEEDFNEAWRWMGKAIKGGNTRAEYDVGTFYRDGYGVAQSYKESAYWFRKAASNGDVRSMVEIGDQFLNGRGVQQDDRIAAEYYWRASERGSKEGSYKYAEMLRDGRGVKRDIQKAIKYFDLAEDYNDADNQAMLLRRMGISERRKAAPTRRKR